MNWIDAIIEMKKHNSKVFQFANENNPEKKWLVRFKDGIVQFCSTSIKNWHGGEITKADQEADWVEVKQFKEVDYAEFMEWYCNPNNKGKKYMADSRLFHLNNFVNDQEKSPRYFLSDCCNFRIPNE